MHCVYDLYGFYRHVSGCLCLLSLMIKQKAFEKCWAHSRLRANSRPLTRCRYRYCRAPPAHRCPRRQRRQRQRVTEGTAMAPWNGPNKVMFRAYIERVLEWHYRPAGSVYSRPTVSREIPCAGQFLYSLEYYSDAAIYTIVNDHTRVWLAIQSSCFALYYSIYVLIAAAGCCCSMLGFERAAIAKGVHHAKPYSIPNLNPNCLHRIDPSYSSPSYPFRFVYWHHWAHSMGP